MPRGTHSIEISASCDAVFELIHNYDTRLQWDSMLCDATLLGAAAELVKGVRTRCVGNWKCLWLAIEADYLSYEKGKVAAQKTPTVAGELHRPLNCVFYATSVVRAKSKLFSDFGCFRNLLWPESVGLG